MKVGNDATAGTWAEAELGAGRGQRTSCTVALGTGIGTGFVVGGRLVTGANGFAGESGHMVVDAHGPAHLTGQHGTVGVLRLGVGPRADGKGGGRRRPLRRRSRAHRLGRGDHGPPRGRRPPRGRPTGGGRLRRVLSSGCPRPGQPRGDPRSPEDRHRRRADQDRRATEGGGRSVVGRADPGRGAPAAVEVVLAELGSDANALGAGLLAAELVREPGSRSGTRAS